MIFQDNVLLQACKTNFMNNKRKIYNNFKKIYKNKNRQKITDY